MKEFFGLLTLVVIGGIVYQVLSRPNAVPLAQTGGTVLTNVLALGYTGPNGATLKG